MIVILIFSTLLIAYYGLLISRWERALKRSSQRSGLSRKDALPQVSLVIPFRDEARHLPALLQDLRAQQYPTQAWEVLLVNDHSQDEYARHLKHLPDNFKLLHLGNEARGKKAAVALGLREAQGDWILQCDADCRLSPHWLSAMLAQVSGSQSLVLGPVAMQPGKGFWSRFAALDFLSLQASGLASAAVGKAFMGSAANLLYRTNLPATLKIDGQGQASGDDVFLIQAAQIAKVPIGLALHPMAVVQTDAPEGLQAFLRQRIRWGAKTSTYPSRYGQLIALLILLLSLLQLFWLVAAFFDPFYLIYLLMLTALKAMWDFAFLWRFARISRQTALMRQFLPSVLIYPFYIVLTSLMILLVPVRWKGRSTS